MFDGMNTDNVIVAGGAVLSCLLPNCRAEALPANLSTVLKQDLQEAAARKNYQINDFGSPCGVNGFYTSDIDLFICGLSQVEATKKVQYMLKFMSEKNGFSVVSQSKQAITLLGAGRRDIQVILRLYDQPAEVMLGFDLDCVAVAYDFNNVYGTPRSLFSIKNRVNVVNQKRRSLNYAQRLIKYGRRGFQVCVPGFSRNFLSVSVLPRAARHALELDENLHTRSKNEQVFV